MQFRVHRQTLEIYDGRIYMATIGDGLVRLSVHSITLCLYFIVGLAVHVVC